MASFQEADGALFGQTPHAEPGRSGRKLRFAGASPEQPDTWEPPAFSRCEALLRSLPRERETLPRFPPALRKHVKRTRGVRPA